VYGIRPMRYAKRFCAFSMIRSSEFFYSCLDVSFWKVA
jgi:hypothetical protein